MSSTAEWKVGLVKSTYFRWEAAGDQCVGSTVAGLQLYSSDFSPTFDDESAEARNYVDKTSEECFQKFSRYLRLDRNSAPGWNGN
eukprot:768793-Hanusia_phi.AAC.1